MSFQTAGLAFQGAGLFAFQEIDGEPVIVIPSEAGGSGAAVRRARYLIHIDNRPYWFATERQVKKFLRKRNRKDEPVTKLEEEIAPEGLPAPSVDAVRKALAGIPEAAISQDPAKVERDAEARRNRALRRRRAAAMLLLS